MLLVAILTAKCPLPSLVLPAPSAYADRQEAAIPRRAWQQGRLASISAFGGWLGSRPCEPPAADALSSAGTSSLPGPGLAFDGSRGLARPRPQPPKASRGESDHSSGRMI